MSLTARTQTARTMKGMKIEPGKRDLMRSVACRFLHACIRLGYSNS